MHQKSFQDFLFFSATNFSTLKKSEERKKKLFSLINFHSRVVSALLFLRTKEVLFYFGQPTNAVTIFTTK